MVLLAGSELFTGNCLLVIPLCKKEITLGGMLKNWVVVYLGNMVGGIGVAAICVFSHQAGLFNNGLAASMISTAAGKVSLSFGDAFLRGIACNFLVCIAVWISFAAKQVSSKIIGLFFPIMMFVLCGFEHSVANMYYIAAGIFAKGNAAYLEAATAAGNVGEHYRRSSFGRSCLLVRLLKRRLKKSLLNLERENYEQIISC